MIRFAHITDTHFAVSSNVRAGEYLDDLIEKFDWVIDWCNKNKAILIHSGDFFDKPSVPDIVKSRVIASLRRLETECYCIPGNHDRLWGSDERIDRTSLNLLRAAGLVHVLLPGDLIEFDDCVLTCNRPLPPLGKPQVVLYHGFLNQEDGMNTFMFQDVINNDPTIILLGHDHVEYELVTHRNATFYRPGSFARGIRNESADRIPQLLDIKVNIMDDNPFTVVSTPIEVAKQVELLFKAKIEHIKKSEVSYDTLIQEINKQTSESLSLESALKMVTTEEVTSYIMSLI